MIIKIAWLLAVSDDKLNEVHAKSLLTIAYSHLTLILEQGISHTKHIIFVTMS